jgi:hypothetical protein
MFRLCGGIGKGKSGPYCIPTNTQYKTKHVYTIYNLNTGQVDMWTSPGAYITPTPSESKQLDCKIQPFNARSFFLLPWRD